MNSGAKTFVPKQDNRIPDSYKLTIHFVNGVKETFEVAKAVLSPDKKIYDFVTKDDEWHWIMMDNVLRIDFDKDFSKMIAIHEEIERNKLKKVG